MNIQGYYDNVISEYKNKLTTAIDAVKRIDPSAQFISFGCYAACPPSLAKALCQLLPVNHFNQVVDIYLFRAADEIVENFIDLKILENTHLYCPFVGGAFYKLKDFSNKHQSAIQPDFIPNHFSRFDEGIFAQHGDPDVHLMQVSPMDKHGYFSFGIDGSFSIPMAKRAKKVIVEVNPNMPRTFGEGMIHISQIDAIIENSSELLASPNKATSETDKNIAKFIIDFIPDTSCVQLGIGSVPNAVGEFLTNKHDLSVHTELLCPSLLALIINGNVTNKYKNINRYHSVFNIALLSSPEEYAFLDDNPSMLCYRAAYVNNPFIISQIDQVISINSFIEIDLYGQVASESIAWKQLTGTGGQVDYIRGAAASKGGVSILAAHAATKKGTISKIVPRLNNFVTTPRTDVSYVATENGIINLFGMSNKERALQLIKLAAPQFRDYLTEEAKKMNLL